MATFKTIHPNSYAKKPLDNKNEPEYVRCNQCGFICKTDRDTKCPGCGSDNYK